MKKNKLMKSLFFFLFFPLVIFSQSNEPFIKVDKNFIDNLEGVDDVVNEELSLNTYRERFDFLNANTFLNIEYNEVNYAYVKKYLSYRWYGKIIGLSSYYFPLFENKLAQYGMPKELKYLAVVESALNPRAGSWAGAKGLFQFMPATGRQFGLKQRAGYDGRKDVKASTHAALNYLEYLHKKFNRDWMLTLAAYNAGEGTVERAIKRNKKAGKPISFWFLTLPKQTREYVPKFLALTQMIR